ncbi:MAG: protein phosphatase 2C domain-containing protein, partial [archaeon]|nr:protein phosphatase 2C domain-containing protein [archaeon]
MSYNNRNYHFNHNKMSESNPFNYSYKYPYQEQTQPIQQKNPYYPQNNQYNNKNISQFQNPLSQTAPVSKTSLYIPNNKYTSNVNNASSQMNSKEKINLYGQDANENLFKRTLRNQPSSNPIQSSSYGIINNIPGVGIHQNRFDNAYNLNVLSQRRDHVGDLLSYTGGNNSYGYNYGNNSRIQNNQYMNQKESESKINENYSQNPSSLTNRTPNISNRNTPMKNNYSDNIIIGAPVVEKVSIDSPQYYEKNGIAVIEYAYKEDQNGRYRNYMEDRGRSVDCLKNDRNNALFCLFDGHGGGEVSKYLQDNLHNEFRNIIPNPNLESSIITLFENLDNKIKNSNFFHVGSTACVVFITRENGRRFLYCANIGDTRCILLNSSNAERLSYDDRASDKNEYERILNAGGIVFAGRVYGQLMLSRAFGDWELKPYGVINVPHIIRREISERDHYVIMGSDGIWDVFSEDDIYKISMSCANAEELCNKIVNESILKGSMDNLSCFV